jgi:drug/metabolite transporter (DMT)-like permease
MWLLYAFSGPVFWAASIHIDKYILNKYFKHGSVAVSMVFTAMIGLLMLPFILFFVPGVFDLNIISILVMIASGLLYMGGLLFYLYALQSEEASIVAMLSPIGPILAYGLAFIFLGEKLTGLETLGGALVVAGAFLASLRLDGGKIRFRKRATVMMSVAVLCFAFSAVIFKFFAVAESFWPATFWTYVGEALFGACILLKSSERKIFAKIMRYHPKAVLTMNGANELINLGGSLGARYALVLAPLALVQAVTSTTPLFTFVFALLITVFLPKIGRENFSKKSLIQKAGAAVLVALGLWLAG